MKLKMAIQKIFKGSDLLFDVRLVDATGTPYRIKDTAGFSIKFYTSDPADYIECKYENGVYSGIIEGETIDSMFVNSTDLERLKEGLINYIYMLKVLNPVFSDGTYDETVTGQTNLYLKSNNNGI